MLEPGSKNIVHHFWPTFLAFIVFILHSLLFRSWLIDDAGISFAYARNFIHGHGLVAQAGVAPVEGFSNPLWTFLIAPLFIADPINPTVRIKLMSFCLIFATFVVIHMLNRHIFGLSWWASVVTVSTLLFASLNSSFVIWTTSGLENPLYACLSALYCLLSLLYASDKHASNLFDRANAFALYAGLTAAGLALTRPEGLVFLAAFPAVLAVQVVNDISRWKAASKRLGVFILAAFIPLAAYLLFRIAYFNDAYPNTYYAKGGPSLQDLTRLMLLIKIYIHRAYEVFYGIFSERTAIFLFLLLCGMGTRIRRFSKASATIFLYPFLGCALAVYVVLPTDWMEEYRFATPFFLLLPLVSFTLLADVLLSSSFRLRTQKIIFVTVAVALLVHTAYVYKARSFQFAKSPMVPFEIVAQFYGIGFNNYADELGISDATFLLPDLGGTLYFSKHRVYDLAGLCDRQIARLIRTEDTTALRNHIFSLLPTFIHVHGYWSVKSGLFHDIRFRKFYTAIVETESQPTNDQDQPPIYNGDYVLKDAIASPQFLERLRERLQQNAQQEHRVDEKKARPFPRG